MTAANKFAHLFRAKQLLRKYPAHTIPSVWFSDAKFLLLLRQRSLRMIAKLLCFKLHIFSRVF